MSIWEPPGLQPYQPQLRVPALPPFLDVGGWVRGGGAPLPHPCYYCVHRGGPPGQGVRARPETLTTLNVFQKENLSYILYFRLLLFPIS